MLMAIRDRAQGVLAWVIVSLLIIPFALWGINSYFSATADTGVAEINGEEITDRILSQAMRQQGERLRQVYGQNFDPDMLNNKAVRLEVLNRLVNEEVVLQSVRDAGFVLGNAQLNAEIRAIPAFQVDGKFDQQQYQQALRNRGESRASFEANFRRSLVPAQLYNGIERTGILTQTELKELERLRGQKRDVSLIKLEVAKVAPLKVVSGQAVSDYYKANQARYMAPEQVNLDYIELKLEDFLKDAAVSADDVLARYEQSQSDYGVEEERRASHILVTVDSDASEDELAAAKSKIEDVAKRLRNGGDFARLAKKYSDDPGSAGDGGDLGFFGRGVMDSAFEEAAFNLKQDQTSAPVRSEFGFHLIRLTEVRGASFKPFDQVSDQIEMALAREKAELLLYEVSESLNNLAFENPESLAVAAEELGLIVKQTGFISRSSKEGIAAFPAVIEAAFSEEVLETKNNSEVIELEANGFVVVRVREHKPAQVMTLDDVRDQVVANIKENHARDQIAKQGRVLLVSASSVGVNAAARKLGLEARSEKALARGQTGVDPVVLRAVFAMSYPQPDKPSVSSVALANGDIVVIQLDGLEDGNLDSLADEQIQPLQQTMLRAFAQLEVTSMITGRRAKAEVRIKSDNL